MFWQNKVINSFLPWYLSRFENMVKNSSNDNIPCTRGYRLGNLACHPTTLPWCLFWYHSPGKKQAITIRSSGGLSDAEIDRMVNEAESMRESDQRKKDGWTDDRRMSDVVGDLPRCLMSCCPGVRCLGGTNFSGGGDELVGLMMKRGWQVGSSISIAFGRWNSITKPFQAQKWIKMGCHVYGSSVWSLWNSLLIWQFSEMYSMAWVLFI